jgi:hypothetical protein
MATANLLAHYWTTQAAATHFGVKPRVVRLWCNLDLMPGAIKVGRDWLIPRTARRPESRQGERTDLRKTS